MSLNYPKSRGRRVGAVIGCGLLIVISLITFQQQIPTIAQTTKIYDREYIGALKHIADIIPQNETVATTENYPQVMYFTDDKVKVPWVNSERSLVEFMWKTNGSYLLVPEDKFEPKPDSTPLLIQLAEMPFEKIFDYFDVYVSKLKSQNTPLFNISEPKQDNTPLNLQESIKEELFGKLFEKILDYDTEGSILHLYHLRSNITRDNLSIVTDRTKPTLFVSLPINGTIVESKFHFLRLNVTGTAIDADSNINKIEISVDNLPFQLATPGAPNDWSTWSFSDIVTSDDTKRIMVRATDNADNKRWLPVYITIK
jgi:hypothetical protein